MNRGRSTTGRFFMLLAWVMLAPAAALAAPRDRALEAQ